MGKLRSVEKPGLPRRDRPTLAALHQPASGASARQAIDDLSILVVRWGGSSWATRIREALRRILRPCLRCQNNVKPAAECAHSGPKREVRHKYIQKNFQNTPTTQGQRMVI